MITMTFELQVNQKRIRHIFPFFEFLAIYLENVFLISLHSHFQNEAKTAEK